MFGFKTISFSKLLWQNLGQKFVFSQAQLSLFHFLNFLRKVISPDYFPSIAMTFFAEKKKKKDKIYLGWPISL